ncbi:DUF1064 domain-containing protein [Candidatus Magnetobacterium casense]|uniref:DUF1064 domain-containing protein n=1 Tax=Candidatus Magnetobacterium casense TaxID=1455061 RepID=A0ABS6S5I6_9BACT|nr:DUF1064 domain-containing protein [Candidatus Magnetobacterium casensis]MBV6343763.1 DUF1064 domain-containing protein [Candidatus Magnetobacterium casensis]
MSKYNAQPTTVDGLHFDSKREALRYMELKVMQDGGAISSLVIHPVFELQPAFTDGRGKRHRAITYEADFSYLVNPELDFVVEDVKGITTQAFQLKHKLMLFKYPGIDFRIVR